MVDCQEDIPRSQCSHEHVGEREMRRGLAQAGQPIRQWVVGCRKFQLIRLKKCCPEPTCESSVPVEVSPLLSFTNQSTTIEARTASLPVVSTGESDTATRECL